MDIEIKNEENNKEDLQKVEITPVKKIKKKNKIIVKVNFYDKNRNRTSIAYKKDSSICSTFIKGEYSGELEIEYLGDSFNNNSITNVKAREK